MKIFGISIMHLVFTIAGSFLGAWLATLLAFRKFKKERAWEYKSKIYKEITNALHVQKEYAHYTANNFKYSDEINAETFNNAIHVFTRFRNTASLYVIDESINLVKQYEEKFSLQKISSSPDIFNWTEIHKLADNCLNQIIELAKKDL